MVAVVVAAVFVVSEWDMVAGVVLAVCVVLMVAHS